MTLTHLDLDRIEGLAGRLRDGIAVRPMETADGLMPDLGATASMMAEAASDLTALITRIRELEGGDWQDISTAPKDGTRVLGWNSSGCTIMQWNDAEPVGIDSPGLDAGWLSIDDGGAIPACPGFSTDAEGQPIHWRPLPAPPALLRKTP